MTESIIQQKTCSNCKEVKLITAFYSNKNNKDGRNTYCKPCHQEYLKNWKKTVKGRESGKNSLFKSKFGISLVQYNQMLSKQNSLCDICKTHTTKNDLHVDHCHLTGKVRGLLCGRCNTALGLFKDNIGYLQTAIAYLQNVE